MSEAIDRIRQWLATNTGEMTHVKLGDIGELLAAYDRINNHLKLLVEIYGDIIDPEIDLPIVKIWGDIKKTFHELNPNDIPRTSEEIMKLLGVE